MWENWGHPIAGAVGATKTARRLLKPIVILFCIGIVIAGLIYAYTVFHAASERSEQHHVHAHSTH